MKTTFSAFACALLALANSTVSTAQEKQPAEGNEARVRQARSLADAKTEVYKTVGDVGLKMHIFYPSGHKPSDRRGAIVFFFGGGWRGGSPGQFAPHCRYLASRGMVAMAAEYRVHSRHKAEIVDCVADAKSAIRWVKKNADRLGVDPEKVASAGGSAGGHLAAAVGTLKGLDDEADETSVSSEPACMALFNPVLDLKSDGFKENFREGRYPEIRARMGAEPEALSPVDHVKKGTPPAIIFHGKADSTVPFAQAERFTEAMSVTGARCQLEGYEGQPHGFFNYGRGGNRYYEDTLRKLDVFLASLEFLEGEPTLGEKPQASEERTTNERR